VRPFSLQPKFVRRLDADELTNGPFAARGGAAVITLNCLKNRGLVQPHFPLASVGTRSILLMASRRVAARDTKLGLAEFDPASGHVWIMIGLPFLLKEDHSYPRKKIRSYARN
jgi:hypothetical protein